MSERGDQDIGKLARAALERAADDLDPVTTAQLVSARRRALASLHPKRHWQPLTAWAMAAGILLAVGLWWWHMPGNGNPDVSADDFEMLVSGEHLDLYENLDFYDWLGNENHAG